MEFRFVAKKPVTASEERNISIDIRDANEKSRKNYSKIHNVMKNRVTRYTISKIPFLETLPTEAEYFSGSDFFTKLKINGKIINIEVDDAAIRKIEQSQLLGINELSKIRGFFHEKLGMEPPKTLNSVEGLRSEIKKALKYNGVEVNG